MSDLTPDERRAMESEASEAAADRRLESLLADSVRYRHDRAAEVAENRQMHREHMEALARVADALDRLAPK